MKTVTLQTAVTLAIKELELLKVPFSAHTVTKGVRLAVDDEYTLSDADDYEDYETPTGDYETFTVVDHSRVKAIVVELFENGLFEATKSYTSLGDKSFTVYTPVTNTVVDNTITPPSTAPVPTPYKYAVVPDWTDKILPYVERKGGASAKQIQSALKIKGITCKQILDELEIDVPTGLTPSKTFVFVGN